MRVLLSHGVLTFTRCHVVGDVMVVFVSSLSYFRLSIKEILFPVQRVAKIEASRAAAIFLFFFHFFFFHENIVHFWGGIFFFKNERKSFQLHLF